MDATKAANWEPQTVVEMAEWTVAPMVVAKVERLAAWRAVLKVVHWAEMKVSHWVGRRVLRWAVGWADMRAWTRAVMRAACSVGKSVGHWDDSKAVHLADCSVDDSAG